MPDCPVNACSGFGELRGAHCGEVSVQRGAPLAATRAKTYMKTYIMIGDVNLIRGERGHVNLEIELNSRGAAARGVDMQALQDNIQAELNKIAASAKIQEPRPTKSAPPAGAQGDAALIHWLLHLAGEPSMIKVYARAAVFGVNEFLRAARRRIEENENGDKEPETLTVRIKRLAKDIVLPATEAAIKATLDETHLG